MNPKDYISSVITNLTFRNPNEKEFLQAVEEVLPTLEVVLDKHPEYIQNNILERFCEPERQIMFRVPWMDDNNNVQVNRGFRVQFNGAIGPYKGGLRFHPSVYLGIIKFLGFEQVLKNSLTGLPIGGGKGGSDFDPKGKSDSEIRRFCESFMTELYRHIGPDIDVPAGDIGVGGKEVAYMFGQYRRIKGAYENGVLTGKGLTFGGSLIRPEATGYGCTYFCEEMLKHQNTSMENKIVVISGYGQVALGVCKKVTDLGGRVVTISGSKGYVYDRTGICTKDKFDFLSKMRTTGKVSLEDYATKFNCEFYKNEKPWNVKCDIVMPCATQNEITLEDAKIITDNKVKFLCEGANMPTTNEALTYFKEHKVLVGPAKAANAGGVAVSALEMSQNSMRLSWSAEEVDKKLHEIMISIHKNAMNTALDFDLGYDLISGANIAGFTKVAEAMNSQGIY